MLSTQIACLLLLLQKEVKVECCKRRIMGTRTVMLADKAWQDYLLQDFGEPCEDHWKKAVVWPFLFSRHMLASIKVVLHASQTWPDMAGE